MKRRELGKGIGSDGNRINVFMARIRRRMGEVSSEGMSEGKGGQAII